MGSERKLLRYSCDGSYKPLTCDAGFEVEPSTVAWPAISKDPRHSCEVSCKLKAPEPVAQLPARASLRELDSDPEKAPELSFSLLYLAYARILEARAALPNPSDGRLRPWIQEDDRDQHVR